MEFEFNFRTLDLKLVSANNLKSVNLFSKMDVYVVVSIHDVENLVNWHTQKTPVDKKGDTNPTWNHTLNFTLDDAAVLQNRLSILFRIYSRRVLLPDTGIGDVTVSVSDLVSGAGDGKESGLRSYEVRGRRGGKAKGVLNFSYKFGEKFSGVRGEPSSGYGYQQPPLGQPVTASPAGGGSGGYGYPYQGQGYGYGAQGYTGTAPSGSGGIRSNNFGMGLMGGALAGMVIGDTISDAGGGGCGGGGDGGGGGGGGGCGGGGGGGCGGV